MKFEIKDAPGDKVVRFELVESYGTLYLRAWYKDDDGDEGYDTVGYIESDTGKLTLCYLSAQCPLTRDSRSNQIARTN